MAKKPKTKAAKAKPQKKNKLLQMLAWVLAPPIAYFGHPTLIVALAGMIPTFVAYIVDNRPQRYAARTVGYMNFAGVSIVAAEMWGGDNTWQRALELIAQPTNWLIMFGCAAVGWIFFYAAPPIVFAYLTVANEVKLKQLQKEQRELIKEWGDEIKSVAPDPDAGDEDGQKQIESSAEPTGTSTDEPDTEPEEEPDEDEPKKAASAQ